MFLLFRGKIRILNHRRKRMKKVFGILLLSFICIALGLSVRWSREQGISLVTAADGADIALVCYE